MKTVAKFTLFLSLVTLFSCTEENPEDLAYFFRDESGNIPSTTNYETGSVNDIDGNSYKTVQIGEQWWMAENLKTTRYSDGTYLSKGYYWDQYYAEDARLYFVYNDDEENAEKYGYLYTWQAAMGHGRSSNTNPSGIRGICPEGWHVPSDEEWIELEMELGLPFDEAYSSYRYWNSNEDFVKKFTERGGFNALYGGCRSSYDFYDLFDYGYFWSCTQADYSTSAYYRQTGTYSNYVERSTVSPTNAYSIRCVKDDPGNPSTSGSGNYFTYNGISYDISICLIEYYNTLENGYTFDTDISLFTDGTGYSLVDELQYSGTGKVVYLGWLISGDRYMEDGTYTYTADSNYFYIQNNFSRGIIATLYDGVENVDEGVLFSWATVDKKIFGSDVQVNVEGQDEFGNYFEGYYFGPYEYLDYSYSLKSTMHRRRDEVYLNQSR